MMKQEKNNRSLRKNILLFIGVLVSSFILHEVHGQDEKPSLLWEVTGNNIQTSYLYGSIHILPKADYEMKEKVVSAFEKADQVVLELDMDQPGLQMAIMKHMQMKEGMTLDQLFSSEDYAKVDKEVKAALGVGLENFNTFKPFFLISLLTAKLMGKELESFEQTFVQMAKDQQKEVLGLETIEFQASIFDRIPYEEQALDVLDLVNDKERNIDLFEEMIGYYQEENIEELYQILKKELSGENELEVMLHERNQKWVADFKGFAADKSSFFAVGAGHLGGELGVVTLLKEAGYQVTPVF